ncbi:hypothetical protein [Streptomyces sp. NPDC007369]|uniref:hypothetical protein n=1 Tax=Streptomyces sp. NPDC007369 TaxID=3154589 RepID=UPI0033D0A06D
MNQYDTYHTLLARQDAMRLRRQMTAPARQPVESPAFDLHHPEIAALEPARH